MVLKCSLKPVKAVPNHYAQL